MPREILPALDGFEYVRSDGEPDVSRLWRRQETEIQNRPLANTRWDMRGDRRDDRERKGGSRPTEQDTVPPKGGEPKRYLETDAPSHPEGDHQAGYPRRSSFQL